MLKLSIVVGGAVLAAGFAGLVPAQAETVIQQCGQQYQAAKAGGTLNGMTWNQYRADCSARLKATPASTGTPAAPAPSAPPVTTETPPKPTTTAAAPAPVPMAPAVPAKTAAGKPVSPGRTAMLTRERQCGAEWRTQKVSLVAATPGLTWPKYWSACNTRLKAAVQ